MKQKILSFLKEQQEYISGQDLSNQLGVSRTAIWKYINALREDGYEILSVTRKGYRLVSSPDVLSKDELKSRMPAECSMGEITVYDSIDSTNEEAKRAYGKGYPDRSLFVADQQTAGKGRLGRVWSSPKGEDIFFSFLLKPDLPTECASMVTLVAALAGVETVEQHAAIPCQIKWPNDIVMNGRKICGILTEMSADMDQIHYIVTGIGFNLNRTMFEESISSMASSIYRETGEKVDRTAFLFDYIQNFYRRYDQFLKEQNLGSFIEEYNQHLINVNREVKLIRNKEEVICTALGINEWGELLVRDAAGNVEGVYSGEVSVRGLYGYV